MKYKKIDILLSVIGIVAYAGTLLGTMTQIEIKTQIVLATTAILFILLAVDGFSRIEE